MNRLVALAPALVLLVACGSSLPEDLPAALTETGGCGDVVFYGHDTDDTILLRVVAEGLVTAANEAGEPITRTFTLPDPAVTVEVDVGSRISDGGDHGASGGRRL